MYTDEDRQSALTRALIMAGGAMTQPGPGGAMAALGRGGMMGAQTYHDTFNDLAQRKLREEALKRSALEDKLKEIAIKRQEALAGIFNQFGGGQAQPAQQAPRPSMMDAPSWAGNPANPGSQNAAPSVRPQPQDIGSRQEALIRALSLGGFQNEAKGQLEVFKGLEGEVYGEPQVDKNGRSFVNTKRGPRYLEGGQFVPRDKLVMTDTGDRLVARTEYDLTPRGEYAKGMSPDAKASNALGWANYFKPELRESGTGVVATSPDGKGGLRVMPTDIPRKAERLPSGDAEKILTLDEMVARGRYALEGVTKNPDAVGPANALTPAWVLNMGKTANVDTRAKLSELSTFILNARSGAAVTEPEYRRLEPFLATANDNAGSAKTKLKNLIKTMDALQKERRQFYTSQGYNVPPPQFGQGGITAPAGGGDMPTLDELRAELERRKKAGQ